MGREGLKANLTLQLDSALEKRVSVRWSQGLESCAWPEGGDTFGKSAE